jgi:hypothetical protein
VKPINSLLKVDAAINLVLGSLLLLFPEPLVQILGVPASEPAFYPSILGAVLIGIGIALLIQRKNPGGLGLHGAVAINMCGGLALGAWLLFGSLSLPTRGYVGLWGLVVLLVGLSTIEWFAHRKRREV